MKKLCISAALYFLLLSMILSSCTSIYVDTPTITNSPAMEVDYNDEYFSLGTAIEKNDDGARIYNNTWIYMEEQKYQKCIRTNAYGEKIYTTQTVCRFVKYNAHTGEVSSVCLDPICTHGPESGCIFIAPENTMPAIQSIIGDWLVFSFYHYISASFGFIPESYVYNLKTGEFIQLFEFDVSDSVISRSRTWCFFENKIYVTKQVLDYTDTKYVPGEKTEKTEDIDDYTPKTKTYLCEYNFDTRKFVELLEVPADYLITGVTNKKFYYIDAAGDIYSSNRDGSNMTKEKVLDFSPQEYCGTYGYAFNSEIFIYDLSTDTKKVIPKEYSYQKCYLTNEGILFSTFSDANVEYAELLDSRSKYSSTLEFAKAVNKYRYESTEQLYLMDFEGNNKELLFEADGMFVDAYYKSGKYIYARITYPDPENNYIPKETINDGRAVINIETGEITMVPILELIIPEEYK